jgi:hypothetical protein
MARFADLVLSDGKAVEAVGWLDGSSTPRSLQLSPSWRPDRRPPVQGGSVDVYLFDGPPAAATDEEARVRVVGEWREPAIHNARFEAVDANNSSDGGGRLPDGPPGSHLTEPSPAESALLERLLAAGDISWHRVYGSPDGRRSARIGTDRRGAIQNELAVAFPGGVEFTETVWSQADLRDAMQTLSAHHDAWHIVAAGGGFRSDPDAAFGLSAEVLHVDPGFADWVDSLPSGLLDVAVLVRPTRATSAS